MLACRLVWPHAQLTIGRLFEIGPALPFVLACGAAMVALDIYATLWVTEVNRTEVEKYFDQAEFWLRSWTAPVVRVFTLGRIHPRRMVNEEVRKTLIDVSMTVNSTMWWLAAQTGLRIAYGLSLWLTFAFTCHHSPPHHSAHLFVVKCPVQLVCCYLAQRAPQLPVDNQPSTSNGLCPSRPARQFKTI